MHRPKHLVKKLLQSLLGFEHYLFLFSIFKIVTLPWERSGEGDFNLFVSLLPRDGIVLDVGANIGIMTVLLARHLKHGTVHAFEPIPANFSTLDRIVRYFKLTNVVTNQFALGDKDGPVEMVLPSWDSVKLQGLGHVIGEGITDQPDGEHFIVPCHTLDGIGRSQIGKGDKVTGIKIDVEGFEHPVLRGAEKLIAAHRPIIYCEIGGPYHDKTLSLLRSYHYQIMVARDGALVTYNPHCHQSHWNYFGIPY